jgi:peptidyl-prolyl cis-trans isomerase D
MKLRNLIVTAFFLGMGLPVFSQVQDSLQARDDIQTWADVRKAYFRTTKNDSLFVSLNSDTPYEISSYYKGELNAPMEMMFFNANVGDVLGPLFIDDYAMIFKVVGFDTLYKSRISHIYIQPDGKSKKDTLQALKKANQYLAKIQKGEDFAQLATKYGNDATAKNGGDMGWLWEGTMVKEFEEAVAKAKKGDVFVLQTPVGAHVVKLTEDKVRDIGRIRLIPVVKKI